MYFFGSSICAEKRQKSPAGVGDFFRFTIKSLVNTHQRVVQGRNVPEQ